MHGTDHLQLGAQLSSRGFMVTANAWGAHNVTRRSCHPVDTILCDRSAQLELT